MQSLRFHRTSHSHFRNYLHTESEKCDHTLMDACLLICGLFNDAVSRADYIVSYDNQVPRIAAMN
jgi:hypothetical protein